jgi:lipopolysaccharide/colanic/teichoic acid biosynthesis glycosyltransferase
MDIIEFLFFFSWICIGFWIVIEFEQDLNMDYDAAKEHCLDTIARKIGTIILWPILIVVAFLIVIIEE